MPTKDYRNMGGWLLVFVIVSVYGTLLNGINAVTTFESGYALGACLVGLVIALRIAVLVCVFKRNELLRLLLIAEAAAMLVSNFYVCYLSAWSPFVLGQTVGGMIGYALWIAYFYQSKRVKVYLHPHQSLPPVPMQYPVYQQPMQMPQQPAAASAQQAAHCSSCGAPYQNGAHFCGACGQKL